MSTSQLESLNSVDYKIQDAAAIYSPGLVVFKELLMANLQEIVRISGDVSNLRPHCKTHKMPAIIDIMQGMGIRMHKCATLAEGEMLAASGADDILIAYQLVGPNVQKLVQLIDKFSQVRFAVLIDHPVVLDQLSQAMEAAGQTVGVWLDVDSGMGRTGIQVGDKAVELYQMICSSPGVRPAGLHWYDGHHRQSDRQEREDAIRAAWLPLIDLRDRLLMQGFSVPGISAAGTGSFPVLADFGEPNLQLTPGTTTLYDIGYMQQFPDLNLRPAAGVLTRVVSCNRPGFLTLDCGHKSISPDQPAGNRVFFPDLPDATERAHTEEHLSLIHI